MLYWNQVAKWSESSSFRLSWAAFECSADSASWLLWSSLQWMVCHIGLSCWNIGCLQSIGHCTVMTYLQVDISLIELITTEGSEHTNLIVVSRGWFVRSHVVPFVYTWAWYLWEASLDRGSFSRVASDWFWLKSLVASGSKTPITNSCKGLSSSKWSCRTCFWWQNS